MDGHSSHGGSPPPAPSSSEAGHSAVRRHVLHGGHDEVVVFSFWRIDSQASLVVSCLVCFALAFLHEIVAMGRDLLLSLWTKDGGEDFEEAQHYSYNSTSSKATLKISQKNKVKSRADPVALVVGSCSHVLRTFLSYVLMMVVMTLNSWLWASALAGAAAGRAFTEWKGGGMKGRDEGCH